jgi:nucleotide-binding universal stress UspA family protein
MAAAWFEPRESGGMVELQQIIAAADGSKAGHEAIRTAFKIADRTRADLSLLHVVVAPVRRTFVGFARSEDSSMFQDDAPLEVRLRDWLQHTASVGAGDPPVQFSVAYGVPGIEICRFAESRSGDLIVLGRKVHSERSKLQLGDTADAVARRSSVAALFVPEAGTKLTRILVALDGTPRGMKVLAEGCAFARRIGARLHVVTVENGPAAGPVIGSPPLTRSAALQSRVSGLLAELGFSDVVIRIRRGPVSEEVLQEVQAGSHDVLVIGHHRGGPAWLVQSSSTAQQLGHAAPCAVLTVPL